MPITHAGTKATSACSLALAIRGWRSLAAPAALSPYSAVAGVNYLGLPH